MSLKVDQKSLSAYYAANPGATWIALAVIALSYILSSISMSGMNVALPSMAREFSASAVLLGWVPTSFILTNAILVLPCGRLADRVGRKRVYLAGLIVFGLSNHLTTLSTSLHWVIGLRVLQALGAAMVQASGMAIVTAIFPPQRRGQVIGICASSIYLGMAIGPFIAGLLTHAFGWRSVFYFQLPLSALIVFLLFLRLKGEWRHDEPQPFDWVGFLLLTVTLCLLMIGVSGIPNPSSLAMVAAGSIAGAIFCWSQLRIEHPLLHLRAIAGNRPFRNAIVSLLAMYAAAFPLLFILSLYLQFLLGMTAQQAGTLLVIQAALMSLLAPLAGRLSDRTSPQKLAAIGSILAALGYLSFCWLGRDSSVLQVGVGLALVGVGMGLFSSPNQNAAYGVVAPEKLATVSAVLSLGRSLGNILGMAAALSLIALFIGPQDIVPSSFEDFLLAVRCSFLFSLLAALSSAWISLGHWRRA